MSENKSASLSRVGDGEFSIRVQIKHLPTSALLVDTLSKSVEFRDVIADAIACLRYPCFHFSVDFMMPDGSPFPIVTTTSQGRIESPAPALEE